MPYWIFEDGPTQKERVHEATFSRCNDGRDFQGRSSPIIGGMFLSKRNGKLSTRPRARPVRMLTGDGSIWEVWAVFAMECRTAPMA